MRHNRFLAIDFETANYERTSACALGLVVVEDCEIVEKKSVLIRPPSSYFTFTYIHGITWNDVKTEPSFEEIWPDIEGYFQNIDFVAAHNAPFDRSVLNGCCEHYNISPPDTDFSCTLRLSRKLLMLESYNLKSVSNYYGIELDHHNALSDTLACAKIMINFIKAEGDGIFDAPKKRKKRSTSRND
ncbi:MAG TPA: 3'-5' exonuclease [Spirochaetota bacterium]